MDLNEYIAVINGYPKEGISFKDVTPLLANKDAFKETIDIMADFAREVKADIVVGPEARGFLFGAPTAYAAGLGFVPVRKPNKLPREVITYTYELEYGNDTLCMHKDSIKPGDKVLIVDDLIAVGGTIDAVIHMVEELGGIVVGVVALIALKELPGISQISKNYKLKTLLLLSEKE